MRRVALASVLLTLSIGTAPAQTSGSHIERCNAGTGTATAPRIEGCAALITAGRLDAHNLANAYNNRGIAYAEAKDYDKAIADFSEAIRLNPVLALAYANRGGALGCTGAYDPAIVDCNEAIRIDPENANAFNNRGLAWAGKQEFDRAIADYDAAVQLEPGFAAAFSNRGLAYMRKRDYTRAIADFDRALARDGKRAVTLYWRGVSRLLTGDRGGTADIEAALALNPGVLPE